MSGQIYRIKSDQVTGLISDYNPALIEYCNASTELYVGLYNHTTLCLIGLIPRSFVSDTAYIWLHVTPELANHPIVFARHARRFIRDVLSRYATILGHCNTTSAILWLVTLGATFTMAHNNITQFEIRR